MFNRESQIIQLKEVKDCINFVTKSKKLVCIGVDGPTASGKTIFADLLKKEIINISNKDVQIVPLDSLLLDRTIREKSLQNIQNVGIPFEHEAEIHMRFSKFDNLIDIINIQKANLSKQKNIRIENLYSRSDQGRCSGELNLNISNNTVIIFEGHYTTRPEFRGVLDKNFILLAKRKELIKRKIERVANYRNQEEVEAYFELIDEPSYLSNYYRNLDLQNRENKPFMTLEKFLELRLSGNYDNYYTRYLSGEIINGDESKINDQVFNAALSNLEKINFFFILERSLECFKKLKKELNIFIPISNFFILHKNKVSGSTYPELSDKEKKLLEKLTFYDSQIYKKILDKHKF